LHTQNLQKMLPYEVDDALPTSVAKLLWPIKFLKESLGLQNEAQCREWFAKNPEVLKACLDCHRELEIKIEEIQNKARRGLETFVAQQTLAKYELLPRAELCSQNSMVFNKRMIEDDSICLSEAVIAMMDKNAQKVFQAILNQNKIKRVKF